MPGIAGIYQKNNQESLEKILSPMLDELNHSKACKLQSYCNLEPGFAFGAVLHEFAGFHTGQVREHDDDSMVIIDGEFYPLTKNQASAWDLGDCIRKNNIDGFKLISGVFCAAGFDRKQKKITLVADKFGLKPLYYTLSAAGFSFASEIKSLLKIEGISKAINPQAFSDFFHFGFTLGTKTPFQDIHLLGPGTVLIYDMETNRLEKQRYFKLESLFSEKGLYDAGISLEDVAQRFVHAVQGRMDNSRMGISLSGGLDSRAILAAMKEGTKGMVSYTLGLSGCHDEDLAGRMSRAAGTVHTMLELGPEYLGDFKTMAETLIYYSDGLYHPHESTEKLALDYFKKASINYLFRGHGGEIAKAALAYPIQVDRSVRYFKGVENVLDYIGNSAALVSRGVNLPDLFEPGFYGALDGGWQQSLKDTEGEIGVNLAPEDLCVYFYIQEWVRRQVVSSLSIFRSQIEIRLPYLDEHFLAMLLKLPVGLRYTGEIQKKIVELCMPALAGIPDSNTGAPLNAGKLRLYATDKFNSVMRRLSLPGFRHYTEYEKWQRNEFKDSMEKIIFDEQSLDRGIYKPEGLKKVFESHISGKTNHAHLLGTVAGLELWFRIFADESYGKQE